MSPTSGSPWWPMAPSPPARPKCNSSPSLCNTTRRTPARSTSTTFRSAWVKFRPRRTSAAPLTSSSGPTNSTAPHSTLPTGQPRSAPARTAGATARRNTTRTAPRICGWKTATWSSRRSKRTTKIPPGPRPASRRRTNAASNTASSSSARNCRRASAPGLPLGCWAPTSLRLAGRSAARLT